MGPEITRAPHVLTRWAEALMDAFVASGVRDVVVSLGSRSTPLCHAALTHPELVVHRVLDERAAGFLALGQARVTGRPSLLVATSGTAGAHYYPSIIEAGQSFVPMIALTADRPFELWDAGAPQTIDQTKLYGSHVRAFFELGLPDPRKEAFDGLVRKAHQAVFTARFPVPGAVHMNFPAAKPLEPPSHLFFGDQPSSLGVEPDHSGTAEVGQPARSAHWFSPPEFVPSPADVTRFAKQCCATQRGLLVAGPLGREVDGARASIFEFCRLTGFVVLAEATSQLRFAPESMKSGVVVADAFDIFLDSPRFANGPGPEVVVRLGAFGCSRALPRYLAAHPEAVQFSVAPYGFLDGDNRVHGVVRASLPAFFEAVNARLRGLRKPAEGEPPKSARALKTEPWAEMAEAHHTGRQLWASRFSKANGLAWKVQKAHQERAAGWTEEGVVGAVMTACAEAQGQAALAVGNSLAVRHLDRACPAKGHEFRVLHQRGANGIDGLIAGAAGSALSLKAPVALLVGDLSGLHDLGSFDVLRRVQTPLVVVILHNQGGRIFEALPLKKALEGTPLLEAWTHPHRLSFEGVATMFGLRYRRVTERAELGPCLKESLLKPGASVVEAVLGPHEALASYQAVQKEMSQHCTLEEIGETP